MLTDNLSIVILHNSNGRGLLECKLWTWIPLGKDGHYFHYGLDCQGGYYAIFLYSNACSYARVDGY
jgi:hypothetical protein